MKIRRRLSRCLRLWKRRFHIPISLQGGIKINSHRIKSQWVLNSLIAGFYEGDEARSLQGLIQPDDRILELGTGLGYISCLAAKKAHHGRVLSYEANPKMVDLANETIQLNAVENVEIRNGILDIEQGPREFFLSEHFWESSLEHRPNWNMLVVQAESIQLTLEDFSPTVLIVDIEGGEYELFKTPFMNTNSTLRQMSIEFHKCDNPFESFSKLKFDGWESNRNLEVIQNMLLKNHQTVVFTRVR